MGRSKLKTSSFLSYREITNRSENAAYGIGNILLGIDVDGT